MPSLTTTLAIVLVVCNLNAQEPESTSALQPNDAELFVPDPCSGVIRGQPIQLFDGESTRGWMKRDGQPATNWIAQDGTLFRSAGGGDLYHEHWYKDFEFTFEWKISKNGNSGVKYRVQKYGNQSLGCEYQIQDDKDRPFSKHATAGLYAVYEPNAAKKAEPVGVWNTAKIVVCGRHIQHWLNDEIVVSTIAGSDDWLERISSSKFKDKPFFGQNREGRIFLQDHGNPVWFRNLVVVPLRCDGY